MQLWKYISRKLLNDKHLAVWQWFRSVSVQFPYYSGNRRKINTLRGKKNKHISRRCVAYVYKTKWFNFFSFLRLFFFRHILFCIQMRFSLLQLNLLLVSVSYEKFKNFYIYFLFAKKTQERICIVCMQLDTLMNRAMCMPWEVL